MIEVIESGDMPRGGGQVSRTELATAEGLDQRRGQVRRPRRSRAAGQLRHRHPRRTGMAEACGRAGRADDEVQFARDIGPILLANCIECHGEMNRGTTSASARFDRLLRGGNSGPVCAGKPAESLMIKKLRALPRRPDAARARSVARRDHRQDREMDRAWAESSTADAAMPLEDTGGPKRGRPHDTRGAAQGTESNWPTRPGG